MRKWLVAQISRVVFWNTSIPYYDKIAERERVVIEGFNDQIKDLSTRLDDLQEEAKKQQAS